jgi:serine/threonine-protein kinase
VHLRLPHKDKYFSRIHFLMEVNPPHCRVVDMGSRNGTFVNGQKVTALDLKDGDLITAGHTVLRLGLFPDAGGEAPATGTIAAQTSAPDPQHQEGAAPAAQPIPGYHLLRELGRGGLGVVHLARRLADDALVALKTIRPTMAVSGSQLKRFLREAALLQKLDHPHIVRYLDVGEADGQLYFAMEYVPGIDAGEVLKKNGPLPIRTVVSIGSQLLKALEYAHGQAFVHWDIKPSNVLLAQREQGGEVKLADFGLARVYQASQLSGLSMTDSAGSAAAFVPPEQITQFREIRPATDQYGAAATLYNLLTGAHVYDLAGAIQRRFTKILTAEPVPIRQRRAEIPEGLAAVLHRALAREPRDRFADVAEFRKALMEAIAEKTATDEHG